MEPPPQTGTLVEVPPGSTDDSFEITTATTTIAAPPIADAPPPNVTPTTTTRATPTPGATVTAAPPVISTQPLPQPRPVTPPPAPSRAELTPDEATATLRNYVRSTRYYDVAGECIRVENNGYRNAGYAMEVWHSCPGSGGGSRLLGRWRVDAKTREVFRQRDDGRYLRP